MRTTKLKFNEMNTSLVKQFGKHLNNIIDSQTQVIKCCDNIIEKMKDRKRDTGKLNYNKESKLNQVRDDKVSDGVSVIDNYNDMTHNNGDVSKNVVESKIMNNDSDDEVLVGVEVSGELVVVEEIER